MISGHPGPSRHDGENGRQTQPSYAYVSAYGVEPGPYSYAVTVATNPAIAASVASG